MISEPTAKKSKKAEKAGNVKTASGGTPKKYASEPHAKLPKNSGKKIVVEVKMAEDGTHNPDRLLFHIKTNQPIDKGEIEAEESYAYLDEMSQRQIGNPIIIIYFFQPPGGASVIFLN